MNTQVALKISEISVRQDDQGRYCLNDLHKASGNSPKHKPSMWIRSQQVIDLIEELSTDSGLAPVESFKGGKTPGTYVAKELVYSYAMWISASFSLKVIRAYDALQHPVIEHQPEPITNSITINLSPLEPGKVRRWLVSQLATEAAMLHPLSSDPELLTLAEAKNKLIDQGYIVFKKEQLFMMMQQLGAE